VAEERAVAAGPAWRSALAQAASLDFAAPLPFICLAAAYALSRAPFLNLGFGTDPDAWRVALSGYWLWEHHEFYPSRLPGYPLHEVASAAVVQGGPVATNALTVAVSLVGLWFFARIASLLDVPNRGIVVAAFAFTPLLWINSMTTMDYMWALTFIVGAYYFLLARSPTLAGLMLGCAIASRATSALFLLPFLVYLLRDGSWRDSRPFTVSAIFIAMVAWAPIYWRYELSFLTFYDSEVWYLNVLRLLGKDTLGLLGALGVLAGAALSLPRLLRLPGDAVRDPHVLCWVLCIAVTAASFARLPHEAAYLIPLFPFAFLLMARYFQPAALALALGAIVLAGFVDLTSPGDEINSEAFTNARPGRGLVLSNRDTMLAQRDFVDDIEALDIRPRTVVSLGFIYPQFAVLNRDRLELGILEKDESAISQLSDKGKATDAARDVVYVWLLDWDSYRDYRDQLYNFMATLDANRSTASLHDYRPALLGAQLIDLGRGPSGGSGAARTDR
jgi:hypothetical protein